MRQNEFLRIGRKLNQLRWTIQLQMLGVVSGPRLMTLFDDLVQLAMQVGEPLRFSAALDRVNVMRTDLWEMVMSEHSADACCGLFDELAHEKDGACVEDQPATSIERDLICHAAEAVIARLAQLFVEMVFDEEQPAYVRFIQLGQTADQLLRPKRLLARDVCSRRSRSNEPTAETDSTFRRAWKSDESLPFAQMPHQFWLHELAIRLASVRIPVSSNWLHEFDVQFRTSWVDRQKALLTFCRLVRSQSLAQADSSQQEGHPHARMRGRLPKLSDFRIYMEMIRDHETRRFSCIKELLRVYHISKSGFDKRKHRWKPYYDNANGDVDLAVDRRREELTTSNRSSRV